MRETGHVPWRRTPPRLLNSIQKILFALRGPPQEVRFILPTIRTKKSDESDRQRPVNHPHLLFAPTLCTVSLFIFSREKMASFPTCRACGILCAPPFLLCWGCINFWNSRTGGMTSEPHAHSDEAVASKKTTVAAFCAPDCKRCAQQLYAACCNPMAEMIARGYLAPYTAPPKRFM